MIKTLNKSQEELLQQTVDKWLNIGRRTGKIDIEKAISVINKLYAFINQPQPEIIFCQSPKQFDLHNSHLKLAASYAESINSPNSYLNSQFSSKLDSQLDSQISSQLNSQLYSQISSQLYYSHFDSHFDSQLRCGNWWCYWKVFYKFCETIGVKYTKEQSSRLDLLLEEAEYLHYWFPGKDKAFVSEYPEVMSLNSLGQLHNEKEMALRYSDGFGVYSINGITLDEQIILHPETQTIQQIKEEQNNDVRSVRIQRFGWGRYFTETGATILEDGHNDVENTHEALLKDYTGSKYLWATCPSGRICPPLKVPREISTLDNARNWLAGDKPFRIVART